MRVCRLWPMTRSRYGVVESWSHGVIGKCQGSTPQHSDCYTPKTIRSEISPRGRLPLGECLQLGLSLTAALSYLHKAGLVHRDIKLSNTLRAEFNFLATDRTFLLGCNGRAT